MSDDGEVANPWKTQLKRASPPPISPAPKSPAMNHPESPMSPAAMSKRASTNLSATGGGASPSPFTPKSIPVKNSSFAKDGSASPQAGPAQASPPISRRTSVAEPTPVTTPARQDISAVQVTEPPLSRTNSRIESQGGVPEADPQPEETASTAEGAEEPAPPPPVLSLPERVAELEGLLATRERELNASREQVNSLQRLQANSTMDAKVKILNEERVKLASKLKDTETKLNKEIEKLKKDVKSKDTIVADLKARLSKEGQQRKSVSETEMNKLAASTAASEAQLREASLKIQTLQKALAEKEAENLTLAKQLTKAQEAIVNGANVGYDQEVKLHQARSALHAIMSEVASAASPIRDRSSTPRVISTPASPHAHQDTQAHLAHAQQVQAQQVQHPPAYSSPPRYAFNYSPRSKSPYVSPTQYPYN